MLSGREINEAAAKILGDIALSDNVGHSLKKWRTFFTISQRDLARAMGISPSVLSEYEHGRRRSPGISFVRRYVMKLIELDIQNNRGAIVKLLSGRRYDISKIILDRHEFLTPVKATEFTETLGLEVLVGRAALEHAQLYGYTVIDSIPAALYLDGRDFYMVFGSSTERALIFTGAARGRAPMSAVRVYPLKPRMVVLHGPKKVDPLAIQMAARDGVILCHSKLPTVSALMEKLKQFKEGRRGKR
jgi:putative transcriptional regulator